MVLIRLMALFAVLMCALGCASVSRTSARGATQGVFDGLQNTDDELVRKARKLADKYLQAALDAPAPEGLEDIVRQVTAGVLEELKVLAPESRSFVKSMVRETVESAVGAMVEERKQTAALSRQVAREMSSGMVSGVVRHEDEIVHLMQRSAAEAGRALSREVARQFFSEIETQLDRKKEGLALQSSLAGIAEQTTEGAMAGVSAQLERMLQEDCANAKDPSKCPPNLVRRLSRSMAMGAAEGVGYKIEWWHVLLAFVGGALITGALAWGLRRAATRRAPASPGGGT